MQASTATAGKGGTAWSRGVGGPTVETGSSAAAAWRGWEALGVGQGRVRPATGAAAALLLMLRGWLRGGAAMLRGFGVGTAAGLPATCWLLGCCGPPTAAGEGELSTAAAAAAAAATAQSRGELCSAGCCCCRVMPGARGAGRCSCCTAGQPELTRLAAGGRAPPAGQAGWRALRASCAAAAAGAGSGARAAPRPAARCR